MRKIDAAAIERSLELVAEHGDPAPVVYRRLFAVYPEMATLFVRDIDGGIKGNMLSEAIAALLDFIGSNTYGANLIRIEIVNHENLGVPREVFPAFFTAMRDAFAEILGAAWSNTFDTAWRELLGEIEATLAGVR